MKIVAEGVETEEQAKLLRLLRCNELQGFLYSKAVPLEQIEAMLASEAGGPVLGGRGEPGAGGRRAAGPRT
jgi:sensor c-di-GMP phosphodiesterase-like protein